MKEYTLPDIPALVQMQKEFFATGVTRSTTFCRQALKRLETVIQEQESRIFHALRLDLNKSEGESRLTETGMVLQEIRFIQRRLARWSAPHAVPTPLPLQPARSLALSEPRGTVLVLSPWNYPFQLALLPLVDALAAGNCAVLKPSEHAPHTAAVVRDIIAQCFPAHYVSVVLGGAQISEALTRQPFDFLFFTGSARVGKLVMKNAAETLTPVCLELGGKSPCIVDETADLRLAARRIAFGKLLNAGQTCVAPDYILVHESVKEPLLAHLKDAFRHFLRKPEDYPRIAVPAHFEHLLRLMQGETIAFGGRFNRDTQQLAPTLLYPVSPDAPVMQEEIFGPLLPVLTYRNLREALAFVKARPRPLAVYLFSRDTKNQAAVLHRLSFGGGCINDTVLHLANPQLGFGGVGASGMGRYHGKAGFDLFRHQKGVLRSPGHPDLPLRYPPYGKIKQALLRKFW